jgi:hypothetical protein
MRTSTVLVLALGLACGATAAFAQEDSAITCTTAAHQVTAALANTNNEAAQQESKMGLDFCKAGYYHKGMVHYSKALDLLGVKS